MPEFEESRKGVRPILKVYIAQHCPVCREALQVVEGIRRRFLELNIQVVDIEVEDTEPIDRVFSVPTYVLDGQTVSLGNPDKEVLEQRLANALSAVREETG